jgi:hypothetical protein
MTSLLSSPNTMFISPGRSTNGAVMGSDLTTDTGRRNRKAETPEGKGLIVLSEPRTEFLITD